MLSKKTFLSNILIRNYAATTTPVVEPKQKKVFLGYFLVFLLSNKFSGSELLFGFLQRHKAFGSVWDDSCKYWEEIAS